MSFFNITTVKYLKAGKRPYKFFLFQAYLLFPVISPPSRSFQCSLLPVELHILFNQIESTKTPVRDHQLFLLYSTLTRNLILISIYSARVALTLTLLLPTKVLLALLPFFLRASDQSTGTTTRYWGKSSEWKFSNSLSSSNLPRLRRCFIHLSIFWKHWYWLVGQTVANRPVLGLAKQPSFQGPHLC
jgi:hypothetical protein